MQWQAKWIWDRSGEHPRNHWACFRKTFEWSGGYDRAELHITADSRYILYVNGLKAGFGPARCWNYEQSYDTYDIGDYLVPGKNCLAVLVVHYGVSTFQYIEGRGGLLTQVQLFRGGHGELFLGSDATWKNKVHAGYLPNTLKICAQQAWAEVFDADRFDSNWMNPDYDDSAWGQSLELGTPDMQPWGHPVPRDIPFLTSELIYPERVESYREVSPVGRSIGINLRNALFGDEYDANPREFTAYICLNIYATRQTEGNIVFPFTAWQSPRGDLKINGREYPLKKEGAAQGVLQDDGLQVKLLLDQGYNLFLMDISGAYHEFGIMMAFDFASDIRFAPFEEYEGSRCLIIGPFGVIAKYDTGYHSGGADTRRIDYADAAYLSCRQINHRGDLAPFHSYIQPLNEKYILENTAYILSTVKKTLLENEVAPELQNMVVANNAYAKISPPVKGDLELIIDFGAELTGFVGFDISAGAGTIFDFYMFECLNRGVVENTKDLDNTFRYLASEGRQRYESPLRRGFRYIMLTIRNLTKPCRIYSVYTNLSTYPVVNVGRFECSDARLNRIREIARRTTKLCMEDTFVDCPAYEQTFWVGDSRNEALVNYYTFGSLEIVKRSLGLVPQSSRITPFLMDQVPSGWQSIIPDWTFFWITACKEYYQFSKDLDFLKEIYPHLVDVMAAYERLITDQGLFEFCGWNLLDWAPMDTPGSGVVTHQNALLVKALKDTAYIAALVDNQDGVAKLTGLAEKVKRAINLYLWSDEKQAYIDCIHEDGVKSKVFSQQTNTMVYLCDCYDDARESALVNLLLNCPADFVKIGSPFMSFFYLEALFKMGEPETALDYIRKWWGLMLDHGATTCWETFPGFEKGRLTRSHCHAWSAAPGYFLGAYILGVRWKTPGFAEVFVEPNPCGLTWAKGSVSVPGGRIDVEWRVAAQKMDIWIKAPERCRVELKVDQSRWGILEVWLNEEPHQ